MSFFMGFATGLAKSVDTQLKESIERTRDNIDMVSKWRLKKAEEREKERRSKDKEIEKMIKDAAYVISGDQNNINAQNIAASLYEERGLSGFNEDIEFMREQSKKGIRPLDFINRANKDLPVRQYSPSEIIRSLSDAERSYASSDMVFPKGTITPSGIISKIVPGFDVMKAGEERATQQMQQIGMATTPVAPSLSFDRYTFDREGLTYHTKDTNEKLSWLRDIIVNPASTPEQVKKAQDRETALLNLSMEQGDAANALAAAEQMLNRAKPTDENYESLVTQVTGLKDRIALQEAELEGEAEVLKVQANIAARDGTDKGLAKALELNRKARDIEAGGIVTTETKLSDIEEDMKRKQAQFGDAYMNSTGEFVNRGYAEDNKMRMAYRTEIANFKGTTTNDINNMVTTIYSNAKKRLAGIDPVMLEIVNRAETAGGDTGKQYELMLAEMKRARDRGDLNQNSLEAFRNAIRDVATKTKAMKTELGEETISVDRALDILLSESVSDTNVGQPPATGAAADTTAAGQTDAALAGQPPAGDTAAAGTGEAADATGTGADVADSDKDIYRGEDVNVVSLTDDQISEMQIDYPNNATGAAKFLRDSLGEDTSYSVIFDEAAKLYKGSESRGFQDNIQMLVQNADDALEATGQVTTAFGKTTVHPNGVKEATQTLMNNLDIDESLAENLVSIARENLNNPLSSRFLTDENVRRTLSRGNNLTDPIGIFGGTPRILRRGEAVKQVAEKFVIPESRATQILDSMYPATSEDVATDAEIDYGALSTEELTALISDDASTNAQVTAASQELTKRSAVSKPETAEDAADRDEATVDQSVQEPVKPDVIFRGMGSRIPYKKIGDDYYRIKDDGTLAKSPANTARKSILENPNRRDVERVGGVEDVSGEAPAKEKTVREAKIPTQDMNMSDVKAMSDVALISRYISGNMTDDMKNEFKRRLSTPSFVDQAAAIIDKVTAEASKQQVPMARGGLMGR